MMEAAAYSLALLTVALFPSFLMLWFVIHPFAAAWRRLGAPAAYFVSLLVIFGVMALILHFRQPLLRVRFPQSPLLLVLAGIFFLASLALGLELRKQLPVRVLFGLPEVSQKTPGRLITGGLYSRLRHPRYVQVMLGLTALALFTNYLAVWIVWAYSFPAIYLIVLVEERELRQRFGEEYEHYCRRVPRFLPRLSRRRPGGA